MDLAATPVVCLRSANCSLRDDAYAKAAGTSSEVSRNKKRGSQADLSGKKEILQGADAAFGWLRFAELHTKSAA
jgi:hypothetical protein